MEQDVQHLWVDQGQYPLYSYCSTQFPVKSNASFSLKTRNLVLSLLFLATKRMSQSPGPEWEENNIRYQN